MSIINMQACQFYTHLKCTPYNIIIKASGIYSPNQWQSFIPKVDQVVENNKSIVLECNIDCIIVMPNVNLNQLQNFNKIDNINVRV
jgi:hypothetical protein